MTSNATAINDFVALSGTVGVVHKRIKTKNITDPNLTAQIQEFLGVQEVTSRVLAARGFKPNKTLKDYIDPTLSKGLPDPKLLKGLDEATELVSKIVQAGGKIAVACDFDVDGLSGGAQVYDFFITIGVSCQIFVPDRFKDGYGLNENIVRKAHSEGCNLLITVDYGTTNIKEISVAKELGLKTIVIDHHHVAEKRSQPDVFINPNQEGCGFADKILCASGLAWYLLVALRKVLPEAAKLDIKEYLDLACLGTICDMVPLQGANRVIAKRGLEILTNTKRIGLEALKNVAGIKGNVNCHDVGFAIGPRINAAGRMLHGEVVIDLLTTKDTDKASKLSGKLNRLNNDRQDTEMLVKEKAVKLVKSRGILESGIIVWDSSFHTGVVGIVAQRLVEIFYRPSVVMGVDSDGLYKGSVRGIKGFNVAEALHAVGDCLVKFGGHSGAGGLSLMPEKLQEFVDRFKEECRGRLLNIETEPFVDADAEITFDDLNLDLCDELQGFAPFGLGNPTPILLVKDVKVLEIVTLKKAHLKIIFTDGKRHFTGMFWRVTSHPALRSGATVNVAFKLDKNSFNGRVDLQGTIQAVESVTLR